MMISEIAPYLYRGRVALNVLAGSLDNAKRIYEVGEGYVLIGVLSKNYRDVDEASAAMMQFDQAVNGAVSIGLGGGDPAQAAVVNEIVKSYAGKHINQVFPAVGAARANVQGRASWINSLVMPTGKAGYVNISTGPLSAELSEQAMIPVKAAIALVRDMGGNALKFFPMDGLACETEYRAVAKACAEEGFGLEPTGGLDVDNFTAILEIALEAGVPWIIPHVYSSIIDKESGETKPEEVQKLITLMKQRVDAYATE